MIDHVDAPTCIYVLVNDGPAASLPVESEAQARQVLRTARRGGRDARLAKYSLVEVLPVEPRPRRIVHRDLKPSKSAKGFDPKTIRSEVEQEFRDVRALVVREEG